MLGSDLVPLLRRRGYEVLASDIRTRRGLKMLDVRYYESTKRMIGRFKPSVAIHLAAETNLEKCEMNQNHAYLTNTIGTENVALSCRDHDVPMVYVSTAGVFNGEKVNASGYPAAYTEFDSPDPINVYGKSKYEGEKIVTQLLTHYYIMRAGWMIGGFEEDKKFVSKIVKQVRSGKRTLHAVIDKYGTPTYTLQFSKVLLKLIQGPYYGLYHTACTGSGTRYDVAAEILSLLKRTDIRLVPVTSDFFADRYPAPRPRSEIMRNFRLELRGIHLMPNWRVALRHYLKRWFRSTAGKSLRL